MRMLLLAPPGAGKGTQGARLAARYGVPHISTGELLRAHVAAGTGLGRRVAKLMAAGELVPDEVVLALVHRAITEESAAAGFILDGFPRTLRQARTAYAWGLEHGLTFDAVVHLAVPEAELVRRLRNRALEEGRPDDTPEAIRHRLEAYRRETEPLLAFYRARGILVEVDGTGPIGTVTRRIEAALAGRGLPPARAARGARVLGEAPPPTARSRAGGRAEARNDRGGRREGPVSEAPVSEGRRDPLGSPGRIPPSGDQYEIRHGDQRAVVVEVGGGIREYEVGGRPVLDPYPLDQMCDGGHGVPLVPWPNRLADGRYRFDGVEYQVDLTEPARHNAIHGLLRWRAWRPLRREPSLVAMGIRLHPMVGYPFLLDVSVEYALGDEGLEVTTTATNLGDAACPYGCGQHPYLSPGSGLVDEASFELRAGTRIVPDPVRLLPVGSEPVAGTPYDFRRPRPIGQLELDFAFADLERDEAGRAWARLTGPDGRTAALWVDEAYGFLEVYTGDGLAPGRRRRGLGVEPMTCPPNAFQTGEHVVRLEPGASARATWGAQLC
jgi:aldose 1-epimerase